MRVDSHTGTNDDRDARRDHMRTGLDGGTIVLSGISGCLWGFLGWSLFSYGRMDANTIGGLIASPLIGVVVGVASRSIRNASKWRRCTFALKTLYLAAVAFAIAIAIGSALFGTPTNRTPPVSTIESILTAAVVVLIGLSIGWAAVLWPLAVANHHLIWYLTSGPRDSAPLTLNLRG